MSEISWANVSISQTSFVVVVSGKFAGPDKEEMKWLST